MTESSGMLEALLVEPEMWSVLPEFKIYGQDDHLILRVHSSLQCTWTCKMHLATWLVGGRS